MTGLAHCRRWVLTAADELAAACVGRTSKADPGGGVSLVNGTRPGSASSTRRAAARWASRLALRIAAAYRSRRVARSGQGHPDLPNAGPGLFQV